MVFTVNRAEAVCSQQLKGRKETQKSHERDSFRAKPEPRGVVWAEVGSKRGLVMGVVIGLAALVLVILHSTTSQSKVLFKDMYIHDALKHSCVC